MKNVYLCLALLGALVPMAFFAQNFAEEGFAPLAFVSALFVNPVADLDLM